MLFENRYATGTHLFGLHNCSRRTEQLLNLMLTELKSCTEYYALFSSESAYVRYAFLPKRVLELIGRLAICHVLSPKYFALGHLEIRP